MVNRTLGLRTRGLPMRRSIALLFATRDLSSRSFATCEAARLIVEVGEDGGETWVAATIAASDALRAQPVRAADATDEAADGSRAGSAPQLPIPTWPPGAAARRT